MKRYELDGLKEGYEIISPITVEEVRFMDCNDSYVSLTVVGLENEAIFGLAKRFSEAKEMLIDVLIKYYECLKNSEDEPDKEVLMRSIRESYT